MALAIRTLAAAVLVDPLHAFAWLNAGGWAWADDWWRFVVDHAITAGVAACCTSRAGVDGGYGGA